MNNDFEPVMYETIDTAPKDGTFILVWDGDTKEWEKAAWMKNHSYDSKDKGFYAWCISGTWGDEQGYYSTVDNPVVWTLLPRPFEPIK